MACKTCKKDITGNFICFNVRAGTIDKKGTSIDLPKSHKLDVWLTVTNRSDKTRNVKQENYTKNNIKTSGVPKWKSTFAAKNA